ncbi:MAG: hypothetical protein MZW92_12120 [Comamonadaceae bacterium]|nr:hypothetical protein [Comamonadaceae bacterium]
MQSKPATPTRGPCVLALRSRRPRRPGRGDSAWTRSARFRCGSTVPLLRSPRRLQLGRAPCSTLSAERLEGDRSRGRACATGSASSTTSPAVSACRPRWSASRRSTAGARANPTPTRYQLGVTWRF